MPMYDYYCEVCGAERRAWRKEGSPPRFCNRQCKSKGMAGQPTKPTKYIVTPEMDAAIRRVYLNNTGDGEVRDLAKRLGLPRWKVTRHAINNGYVAKQKKEPDWTEKELQILKNAAHLSLRRIQLRLKSHGYHRTETGIFMKRKRMRYLKNLKGQSMRSLALCFGVDAHTIKIYIKNGLLTGKKRGTDRTEAQGGDMWFIKDRDIRDFVINNVAVVDFRKIDKYWLVDLLAGN